MNRSERDGWLDRSRQRWKLRVAEVVLLGGEALAFFLFFRATWPVSFYGALVGMTAGPLAIAIAASVRCRVCGRRVVFDAPFGRWLSDASVLRACTSCGDDGDGRPPPKTDAPAVPRGAAPAGPVRAARLRMVALVLLFVLFGTAIFLAERAR